jgi:hypothetical protein
VGTTYRLICDPRSPNPVLEWFRALQDAPEEIQVDGGLWLLFRSSGALAKTADGSIDVKRSPLVSLFLPTVRRKILWTVGEVHFLPTPLRSAFPKLHGVSTSLKKWLEAFDCVFSNRARHRNEWNHYLEGSIRNWDSPVYALAGGLEALRRGQYFVAVEDTDFVLDRVCSTLRLRGVQV